MHTGAIEQIRVTADGRRLVTIGHDKTLRVWRLPDLVPLRTVHLPSDPGVEGELNGLALAPDGRSAYAAGWTGFSWHRSSQVYVVDLSNGRLRKTLRGLPGVVGPLALSSDGRRLAVGLQDRLQVIDTDSGALIHEDREYGERVTFADFSIDGSLATTAADGCLRLYDVGYRLTFRAEYPPRPETAMACRGSELGGVRFSPDGRRLALGVQDRPEVVLMDTSKGNRVLRVIRSGDPQQLSLCCVSWSPDSETLTVYGEHADRSHVPLHRIGAGGLGASRRFDVGRSTITNVAGLPEGGLVFSTDGPQLVRLDRQGATVASVASAGGDFRTLGGGLRLSADATVIELPLAPGSAPMRFDVLASPGSALAPVTGVRRSNELLPPDRSGVLTVDAKLGRYSYKSDVKVNGIALKLDRFESVWSWAGHASRPIAAIGTVWAVKLVDAQARVLWKHDLPAPAFGVAISADGRWVLAAVGDGTVRWLDAATGAERLGLFPHVDGRQWVAWRPDGYYASSPQGDALLGWLINRGDAQTPDFLRAVQFERELYRPDLVRVALTAPASNARAGDQLASALRRIAAPRVTIETVEPGAEADTLSIRFSVESTGRPFNQVGVYVDGIPVLTAAERGVGATDASQLTRTVIARVTSPSASVRVEAESGNALGIDESASSVVPDPTGEHRPGRLWVVAAGVQQFDRLPDLRPLPYATNDARELARALAAQQGRAFSEVRTVVLSEASADKPTKANILARLRELEPMRPEDTLVVFLASHGTTDAAEYYFMTKDADPADVRRLLDAEDRRTRLPPGSVPSLLTGTELTAALRRLPGRRILVLDTCHAGAAGDSDPYSLVKRSASAQLAVMSAARGDESSYDSPTQPHGAFTIAVIDALDGRLAVPAGPVTLRDVFDAAAPQVQDVIRQLQDRTRDTARRAAIRQTPVLSAPKALESSILARH